MVDCGVCFQKTDCQKLLSCGKADDRHKLCLACVRKLADESRPQGGIPGINYRKSVSCPFCRVTTSLPNGDAALLETKFFTQLVCEDCENAKNMEEQWWCNTCNKTSCGNCAMKRHRNHKCRSWEEYDVPRECLSIFKSLLQQQEHSNDLKQQIKEFCQRLEADLLDKVEKKEDYMLLVNSMQSTFGDLNLVHHSTQKDVLHLPKKLNTIAVLIKSANISPEIDAEKIAQNIKADQFHIKFPPLNDVIQLFNKNRPNPFKSVASEINSVLADDGHSTDSERESHHMNPLPRNEIGPDPDEFSARYSFGERSGSGQESDEFSIGDVDLQHEFGRSNDRGGYDDSLGFREVGSGFRGGGGSGFVSNHGRFRGDGGGFRRFGAFEGGSNRFARGSRGSRWRGGNESNDTQVQYASGPSRARARRRCVNRGLGDTNVW